MNLLLVHLKSMNLLLSRLYCHTGCTSNVHACTGTRRSVIVGVCILVHYICILVCHNGLLSRQFAGYMMTAQKESQLFHEQKFY